MILLASIKKVQLCYKYSASGIYHVRIEKHHVPAVDTGYLRDGQGLVKVIFAAFMLGNMNVNLEDFLANHEIRGVAQRTTQLSSESPIQIR